MDTIVKTMVELLTDSCISYNELKDCYEAHGKIVEAVKIRYINFIENINKTLVFVRDVRDIIGEDEVYEDCSEEINKLREDNNIKITNEMIEISENILEKTYEKIKETIDNIEKMN